MSSYISSSYQFAKEYKWEISSFVLSAGIFWFSGSSWRVIGAAGLASTITSVTNMVKNYFNRDFVKQQLSATKTLLEGVRAKNQETGQRLDAREAALRQRTRERERAAAARRLQGQGL